VQNDAIQFSFGGLDWAELAAPAGTAAAELNAPPITCLTAASGCNNK
jgi:hypothetical protein